MKTSLKLSNITNAIKNENGELDIHQLNNFVTLSPKQVKEMFNFYCREDKKEIVKKIREALMGNRFEKWHKEDFDKWLTATIGCSTTEEIDNEIEQIFNLKN